MSLFTPLKQQKEEPKVQSSQAIPTTNEAEHTDATKPAEPTSPTSQPETKE